MANQFDLAAAGRERWKTHFDTSTHGISHTLCGVRKAWTARRTEDIHAVTCGRCRAQLAREGQYPDTTKAVR